MGCNWQTKTIVFGLEGDFDYFHSNSNFFNNTDTLAERVTTFVAGQSLTTNYLATVRPRIGIAADRNFAYITGGVAFTEANYIVSYADAAGAIGSASASKFLTGWAVGAGWEHAFADHWTLRFEYLFSSFPSTSASGTISGPGGTNPLSRFRRPRHSGRPRRHELQVLSAGSTPCSNWHRSRRHRSPPHAPSLRLRRGGPTDRRYHVK